MSTHVDCYSTVIGLSRTICDCFNTSRPVGYDESDSGLFLDETEGLSLEVMKNVADCAKGGLWDIMSRARTSGVQAYKTDLMNYIGSRTVRRRQFFSGVIGGDQWNQPRPVSNNFAGLTWMVAPVRSGEMLLKRIGLIFSAAASFDIALYNNKSDTPLYTWNVTSATTTTKGQTTWYTIAGGGVSLPLYDASTEYLRYWLTYTPSLAPAPKNNQVNCGCGNLSQYNIWNENLPRFASPPNSQSNWMDWLIIKGTQGNSLSDRDSAWNITSELNGLTIDATLTCKTEEIMCKDVLDYDNDELAMVQAYAIRYKAAEIAIESILASPNPNRFTMLDRERLWGKRNHYKKEFDGRIEYIGSRLIDSDRINLISDCLTCRNIEGFKKIGIRIT